MTIRQRNARFIAMCHGVAEADFHSQLLELSFCRGGQVIRKCRLGFGFDLLAIIAVSFFNNLEEVKFYIGARQRFGRVVIVLQQTLLNELEGLLSMATLYFLSL